MKLKFYFLISLLILGFNLSSFAQDDDSDLETEEGFFTDDGAPLGLPKEKKPVAKPVDDSDSPAEIGYDDDEPLPEITGDTEDIEYQYRSQPRKIPHPNAKKGLIRITKDKIYQYKVATTPRDRSASLRFGFFDPTELSNPDLTNPATGQPYAFSDFYETNAPILLFDYEWDWFRLAGQWGIQVGSGIFFVNGNGRFTSDANSGLTPFEEFTFVAFPNHLSINYKLDIWDDQFLIPYVNGGLDAFAFAEIRDDNTGPKFGGTLAAHVAAGAMFSLKVFDKYGMIELDREYGINDVYLSAEFRLITPPITGNYDFSANIINGGFVIAY